MNRPSINQQVTFIYSTDLESTADFYRRILGLPLILNQESCQIFGVTKHSFLGVCFKPDIQPNPAGIIITLVSQAVDAWHDYLRQLGVQFEKPPAYNEQFNIYHCFLRDPNGYLIEIQQFLDPAWPSGAQA